MLFTIAIDMLNSLVQHAIRCNILQRLSPRHMTSSISLYADDVVIFCHPDPADLSAMREILCIFGLASGLKTNFAKCSISPIRCTDAQATDVSASLGCPVAHFPVTYLGLPLAIR
uniref:Reverse transcriptase domain-containing protein n=1 Tax=Triticum urartu TaxID=4572 RepID=A0A8R7V6N6_TRIUA